MNRKTLLVLLSVILLSGCGSKENFIILSPAEDGSVGALEIETEKGSAVLEEQGKAIYIANKNSAPSKPTPISEEDTASVFGEAIEVHPLMPESFILYFDLGKNSLTEESQNLVPAIMEAIRDRNSDDISLIGHTDRTGKDSYNETLSLKRAKTVFTILEEAGVKGDDMSITYHGEGNPLIPTEDDVAEPRNRRVEVVVR